MRELGGYRRHLIGIAALGVITAPLGLLQPLALKITFDSYIKEDDLYPALEALVPDAVLEMDDRLGYLLVAVALVVLVAILTQSLGFAKNLLRTYTKEKLVLAFRMRLFGHVERLSLSYHDEKGPSESTFRVMMDTAVIPAILLDGLIPSLQAFALVSTIAVVILSMSWELAVVALLIAPILLLISWPFGKSLRRQWHEIKELETSVLGRLQEVFSTVRVVKAFGREKSEMEHLLGIAEKGLGARLRVAVTQGKFKFLTAMLTAVGTAGFLFMGASMVRDGALKIGELIMIAALMVQFYSPLQLLIGQIASMQSSLASAERVLHLLDRAPEVLERPDARSLGRATGGVRFDGVTFSYEGGPKVLNEVTVDVPPGTRVGIAGATGAGKTTLMSLLTRLYDPVAGAIYLDDNDLRDVKVTDLREQFGVVLQDPVLFKKSVADNIAYGVPDATREDVVDATRLANAHDFVSAMPDGYDTIVGDRGQRLSGGERQRISLARAFLKNAPILILDEPTSSVDMRTEAAIMEALERLMEGRTTFIIAHRPSTLEICDRVLVLDQGRVVAYAAPNSVDSLDELMLARADDGNGSTAP